MTPRKSAYPFLAQAETLLIYGIFLFLTGLAQIAVTISHRYIVERTIHNNQNIHLLQLLPVKFTLNDIHLWYIYPSATLVSPKKIQGCMDERSNVIGGNLPCPLQILIKSNKHNDR